MSRICTRAVLAALVVVTGVLLASAPPAPFPTVDSQGDPLPKGARARLGSGRLRHGYTVSALAFAPDGKTLASTSHEHTLRFWDVATGKQLRAVGEDLARTNVYAGSRWLLGVAYSGDGKTVATVSQDYTVRLYDAATAKEQRRIMVPNGVVSFSLSPNGHTLASVSQRGEMEIWDIRGGKERAIVAGMGPPRMRLLNLSTMQVAFAPGGDVVASGGADGVVRLWDAAKGAEADQLTGHATPTRGLAWSRDGKRLAVVASDGRVIVWDAIARKEIARRDGRAGEYPWVGFLPDNKTLVSAGGGDPRIRVWNMDAKKTGEIAGPESVTSAALSPDGKTLALGTYFSAIYLIDLNTGKPRDFAPGHHGHLHHLAFSADGKRVTTGGSDGTIRLWHAESSKELKSNPGIDVPGTSIAMSGDGRLVAAKNADKLVRLWDVTTGKRIAELAGSEDARMHAALSGDGRALATMHGDGTIRLWDVATAKVLRELKGHMGEVTSVAFAPGGKLLASSGEDVTVRLWEVDTGAELRRMEGFTVEAYTPNDSRHRYSRLAFSRDGRALARGGTDGIVPVWETASGKLIRRFSGHTGYAMALAFSPDGRSLAAGNWMGTRLWDLASGEGRGEVEGHKGDVLALAFSPDGRRLASGGSDGVGYLWDVVAAFRGPAARAVKLSEKDLESCWEDLANASGEKAYQAVWDLASASEQSVALLAKHLTPVKAASDKVIAKLIEDLGDDDFDTRTKADEELAKLGEVAESALRKALASAKDVDLKLRLNVLVGNLKASSPSAELMRAMRAVQVLELARTPAAEKLLRTLADGAEAARLTREAKAALERLR